MGEEDIAAATLAGLNKSCSDVAPKPAEDTTSASLTKTTVSDEIPKKKRGRKPKQAGPKFPVEPVVIQVVNRPKGYMNHSYRDFSKVPPEIEQEEEEQSNNNMDEETRIAGMTFAQKVHELVSLEGPSQNWIAWQVHGRAFKILVPKLLEQSKLLLKYFGHNRYSSFLRQLNNFGFKHISQGPDRNCYYHEFMLQGLPHLCKYMPEGKDARRLIPDPENEPDFYAISKAFPLPGNPQTSVPDTKPEAEPKKLIPSVTPVSTGMRLASEVNWMTSVPTAIQEPPSKVRVLAAPTAPTMVPVANPSSLLALGLIQQQRQQEQEERLRLALLRNELSAAAAAGPSPLQAELLALRQLQQEPPQLGGDSVASAALARYLNCRGL